MATNSRHRVPQDRIIGAWLSGTASHWDDLEFVVVHDRRCVARALGVGLGRQGRCQAGVGSGHVLVHSLAHRACREAHLRHPVELAGQARLETLKVYSHPTDEDKQSALRHLTVDR
jgi:hypothetical protein